MRTDVHIILKHNLLTSNYFFFPLHIFSSDKGVLTITFLIIFILQKACSSPRAFIKDDIFFFRSLSIEPKLALWILSLITATEIRSQICSACQDRNHLPELQMALSLCSAGGYLRDSPYIIRGRSMVPPHISWSLGLFRWSHRHWWLVTPFGLCLPSSSGICTGLQQCGRNNQALWCFCNWFSRNKQNG